MSERTKVFFDTEFTGLTKDTTLISIGCVTESGDEFYAEFTDYDREQVSEWLIANVLQNLTGPQFGTFVGNKPQVADALSQWLSQFGLVEMWSDCLSYDWVLFCDLYGGALAIPPNVSYIPLDISTFLAVSGYDPDISREQFARVQDGKLKHNALFDAQVIRKVYERCMALTKD